MTDPAAPAPPTPIRVLWPVMIVRTVLATATLVSTLVALPGIVDRSSRGLVNQRTGDVITPFPAEFKGVLVLAGVVGALFGAAWIAAWLWAGWRAVRGVRWAAIGVAVLSGLGVVSAVFVAVLSSVLEQVPNFSYAYDYPTWVLVVTGVQAVADLTVVVLLVLPSSRAWIAAMQPPARPYVPPPPPPAPPPPPWPPAPLGPPPGPTGPGGPDAFPSLPDLPHLQTPPPRWSEPPGGPSGRRH